MHGRGDQDVIKPFAQIRFRKTKNDLSSSLATRKPTVEKKRDVGTELGGTRFEDRVAQLQVPQTAETEQRRGSVTRASAKSGSHRDALAQNDVKAGRR